MADKKLAQYAQYVAEQLAPLGDTRYIPMMGGYLYYYRDKIIGGIYGDGFAVKDTAASRRFMPDSDPADFPQTPDTLLPCTILDDGEKLRSMVEEMWGELPERKPRRKSAAKKRAASVKPRLRLDGFGIMVKDMAAMVRFYRDVLGFEIKEDENTSNVFLEKDGTLFLLYRRTDFEKMTARGFNYADGENGHYEIALSAENYAAVDAAFADVVAKGAKPVMPPQTMEWGQRTCYIADPEGNLVEIGSFVK